MAGAFQPVLDVPGKAKWTGKRTKHGLEGASKSGMFMLPLEYNTKSSTPEKVCPVISSFECSAFLALTLQPQNPSIRWVWRPLLLLELASDIWWGTHWPIRSRKREEPCLFLAPWEKGLWWTQNLWKGCYSCRPFTQPCWEMLYVGKCHLPNSGAIGFENLQVVASGLCWALIFVIVKRCLSHCNQKLIRIKQRSFHMYSHVFQVVYSHRCWCSDGVRPASWPCFWEN